MQSWPYELIVLKMNKQSEWQKTLCIDLDQTLCALKKPNESYLDVLPLPGAIEAMQKLKEEGFYLVINTGRGTRTYNHNIGLINIHRVPEINLWLKKHNIPYDEIIVGKRDCLYFIDDKNIEFKNNWNEIVHKIVSEKQQQEK